tara:strand:+ start:830 stop:952 length:123 start_codon:yes stop_codon:yes gene_type:complete
MNNKEMNDMLDEVFRKVFGKYPLNGNELQKSIPKTKDNPC